jgi:hypothetical protein
LSLITETYLPGPRCLQAAAGRSRGSRRRGVGSDWNGAVWASRGRVTAGPLPRARPGEQCHFQIDLT